MSGILKVLTDGHDGEAYNISDDSEGMTLGDYAEYLASLAGTKVIYTIENNFSVSKAVYALLDTSKLKALGWTPLFKVKEGLKKHMRLRKDYE